MEKRTEEDLSPKEILIVIGAITISEGNISREKLQKNFEELDINSIKKFLSSRRENRLKYHSYEIATDLFSYFSQEKAESILQRNNSLAYKQYLNLR